MDPVSAAGLALSVASVSFQVFGGCVKGFVLLSTAHNLGKDASFLRTMLKVEEYRFVQWADTVGLTSPDSKITSRINPSLAEELMVHLQDRFDQDKLRERYKLELSPIATSKQVTEANLYTSPTTRDILAKSVSDEKRGEILARAKLIQNKTSLPKRLWWAAVDKSRFEDLIKDVGKIVDALWALLEPQRQIELSQQIERALSVVIQTSRDIDELKGLQASLKVQTETPRTQASLITAASLKIVREQLPDESGSSTPMRIDPTFESPIHVQKSPLPPLVGPRLAPRINLSQLAQQLAPQPATPARKSPLPPLKITLLKRNVEKSGNSGVYAAEYSDKPVLVEYKKVGPRMKAKLRLRAENLAILLSQPKQPGFWTLECLGFLEEKDEFAFVYDYPQSSITPTFRSLQDNLRDSKAQAPSVTTRIKLARDICRTLLTVHTAGWLHKNIRSENILFFSNSSAGTSLESPYLTGFTFSRVKSTMEISDQAREDPQIDIYRHPDTLGDKPYATYMDLYSLAVVLIEIAEWRPLKHIIKKHVDVTKAGVDVPLDDILGVQSWLMAEKIETGHVHFRMGEVYGDGIATFLRQSLRIYCDRGEEGQEEEDSADLLAFHRFVVELSEVKV